MKNKSFFNITETGTIPVSVIIPVLGTAAILFAPSAAVSAGAKALDFCLSSVIPSLLPFLVFSSLIVSCGVADMCAKALNGIMMPLFGVPGECAAALILGLLSGFPVGAKTAADLYSNGECTRQQAERLLSFCNGAGPAFVIGTVGGVLWNDTKVGIILFSAQTAALILTGILFGRKKDSAVHAPVQKETSSVKHSGFTSALVSAVMSSALTVIYISAFIIFFAVISEILTYYGIIPTISNVISKVTQIDSEIIETFLCGFTEFSTGIKKAAESTQSKAILATVTSAILGWSGLSVHCQVAATVLQAGLSIKKYIFGKIICCIVSAALTFLIYSIVYR